MAGPTYVGSKIDLEVVPIDSVTPSDGTVQEKARGPADLAASRSRPKYFPSRPERVDLGTFARPGLGREPGV